MAENFMGFPGVKIHPTSKGQPQLHLEKTIRSGPAL